MAEHEEIHDEDVIVVMTNEDGDELYYREEMMIPIGADRFAVLIALNASSEDELAHAEEGDEATIAKIVTDEDGEDIYTDPTDEEFEAVCRAYEALLEEEEVGQKKQCMDGKQVGECSDADLRRRAEQNHSEYSSINSVSYQEKQRRSSEDRIEKTRQEYKVDFDRDVEYIHSKIAGVTQNDRQRYVRKLINGQYLKVCRQRNNKYDKNAIALFDGDNQIGYIKKELAEKLAPILDSGKRINVQVDKVTALNVENHYCGVNILISYEKHKMKEWNKSKQHHSSNSDCYFDDYESSSWNDYVDDLYDGNYEQAEDDWNEKFYD